MSSCAKKMNNANEVVKTHEVDSEICVDEETIYSERTPRKPTLMFAMALSDSLQRPILNRQPFYWISLYIGVSTVRQLKVQISERYMMCFHTLVF